MAAEHQRRTQEAPQRHQRALLRRGEPALAVIPDMRTDTDATQRKHVGVGPGARTLVRSPTRGPLELLEEMRPIVPEIVGDPPQLRGVAQEVKILQ